MRDEAITGREARNRIEDLLREYVHCLDDVRLDDWPEFFTEDARYKIISRDSHARGEPVGIFYCESRDMLRDRILTLRETSIYESHFYRHTISATRLVNDGSGGDGCKDGQWTAETSFVIMRILQNGETSIFCTGKYLDTVILDQGQPKFSEKLVLTDSSRFDVMLAIPL